MFFLESDNEAYIESIDLQSQYQDLQETIYDYESSIRDIFIEGIQLEAMQVDTAAIKNKVKEMITRVINFLKTVTAKITTLVKNMIAKSQTTLKILTSKDRDVQLEGAFVYNNVPLVINAQPLTQFMIQLFPLAQKALSEYKSGNEQGESIQELSEFKNKVNEFKQAVTKSEKPVQVKFSQAAKTLTTIMNQGRKVDAEIDRFNRNANVECNKLIPMLNQEGNDANKKITAINRLVAILNGVNGTLVGMFNSVVADCTRVTKANDKAQKQENKDTKKAMKAQKKAAAVKKKKGIFRNKGWKR